MKRIKIAIAALVVFGTFLIASTTVFAAEYATPAEAVAGLTGRTVESIVSERRDTGKTFGTIAAEAGKLEEFQQSMIAIKTVQVENKVANGQITQQQADGLVQNIQQNQIVCDGSGHCGYCVNGNYSGHGWCGGYRNGAGQADGWCQTPQQGQNGQSGQGTQGGGYGNGTGQGQESEWCPIPQTEQDENQQPPQNTGQGGQGQGNQGGGYGVGHHGGGHHGGNNW